MAYPEFNPALPPSIRRLHQRYANLEPNSQHKLNRKQIGKSLRKVKNSSVELLEGFGEKTTIHGLNRLLERNSNKFHRCFWLLTVSVAFIGTIYVSDILSDRFQAGTLQSIVQDTGMGVFRISFPAITICNSNHLNWQRLQAAKDFFLPNETNALTLKMFELVLSCYDRVEFGSFDVFKELQDQPVHVVEKVNFTNVFDFMTWRCDEMLDGCLWRHHLFDCCDIFLKRRSKQGICWSFNTMETPEGVEKQKRDPKYPWHTGNAGPKSALKLKVMINPDKQLPSEDERGITVMVAEPRVWHRDPYFIPENTDTSLDIEPTIYFYDNDTRSLSPSQRQCFFNDERNSHDFKTLHGFVYMSENCESECHQEYLVSYCNCTLDLLFPPGQHKPCRVTDLSCLARYNDYFRYTHHGGEQDYVHNNNRGMVCKCFNNCYSLQYRTYVRPTFIPADVRGNKSYVDLDIHFRSETMMVYCTNLVFSWIDLMVAFGGIAGLFLGCSLISAVEVFHFLFIELPIFVFNEMKHKTENKTIDVLQSNKNLIKNHNAEDKSNATKYNGFVQNRVSITDSTKTQIKTNEPYIINKNYY